VRATWGQGRLGTIVVAVKGERQSTTAWRSGAQGERVVGQALDALVDQDVVVLHDRRIPGSRANIDHLVVTRAGVWVVDAKRYQGRRPRLEVEGGLFRPRVEKLRVGGGDRTKLVEGVLGQVARVQQVLGAVPVRGVLCFVDADWPLLGGSFSVRDVEVCWPKRLGRVVTAGEGHVDVDAVASALSGRFASM